MSKPSFQKSITNILFAVAACGLLATFAAPFAHADDASSSTAATSTPIVAATSTADAAPTGTAPDASTSSSSVTAATSTEAPALSSTPVDASSTTTASSTVATTTDSISSTTTPTAATTNTTTTAAAAAASTTPASSTISTGDAAAITDVSNVVNVNLVDSQGLISFLNLIAPYTGTIDFSGVSGGCTLCQTTTLQLANTNSSTLANDLGATATSGANTVEGSGTIATGNAFAAANLINVANANLTDANYLLMVFNTPSDVTGDIVLPGADFFAHPSSSAANAESSVATAISNDNASTVANGLDVHAETGDNGTANGTSSITTGSALSASNVLNVANANVTDGEPVIVLVRVFGTWNGSVVSAPPGLYWQQTPNGLVLMGQGAKSLLSGTGAGATATDATSSANTDINNENNAGVNNTLKVYALTGKNEIKGDGSITTGNATAVGNVVNLVNTNIVGRNVLLALVNIFGTWNGNLDFGRPDLWVGTQAAVDISPLQAGEPVTYHVTVTNRGDADATNVHVTAADSAAGMATVSDPGDGTVNAQSTSTNTYDPSKGTISWDIADLAPGASKTFTYEETMAGAAANVGQFTETVTATEHENDANAADNTDAITFPTGAAYTDFHDADLALDETTNVATGTPILPGSTVHYTLTVSNKIDGAVANGITLYDSLANPEGTIITGKTIRIGQLYPGKKVTLNWDAQFPANAEPGAYVNTDKIDAYDQVGIKHYAASSTVMLEPTSTSTAP